MDVLLLQKRFALESLHKFEHELIKIKYSDFRTENYSNNKNQNIKKETFVLFK
jgi:hypothetical protein